jgi:hypothetical protein
MLLHPVCFFEGPAVEAEEEWTSSGVTH